MQPEIASQPSQKRQRLKRTSCAANIVRTVFGLGDAFQTVASSAKLSIRWHTPKVSRPTNRPIEDEEVEVMAVATAVIMTEEMNEDTMIAKTIAASIAVMIDVMTIDVMAKDVAIIVVTIIAVMEEEIMIRIEKV